MPRAANIKPPSPPFLKGELGEFTGNSAPYPLNFLPPVKMEKV